jgi:hypothetical protein
MKSERKSHSFGDLPAYKHVSARPKKTALKKAAKG